MDYEDDLNLGEYYDNRDIFPQPNPENMPYESSSSGEPQPTFENDNSQPNEVDCERTEPMAEINSHGDCSIAVIYIWVQPRIFNLLNVLLFHLS